MARYSAHSGGGLRIARRMLGATFRVFDAVVLVLFLIGFAAAYLHPSWYWWGAVVAVGLSGLAVLMLLTAVVHLVRRRWFWGGFQVVLLLIFVGRSFSLDRLSSPAPADDDLVLMTVNLPRYPENMHAERSVLRLVKAYTPDVIGVQESILFSTVGEPNVVRALRKLHPILDSLQYHARPPKPVRLLDGKWYNLEQPVLLRPRILEQEQLRFERTAQDVDPLRAVRTRFKWQGREAVHYNLHLRTFGTDKPWENEQLGYMDLAFWRHYLRMAREAFQGRAWQVEAVRRRIDQETLPVLISGDFNSTPHSWSYRTLSKGYRDVFRHTGKGWGGTYPVNWPVIRIDFVLAGPEWEPVSALVPKVTAEVSDHRPLVARLRWAP